MRILFCFFMAFIASTALWAYDFKLGNLYYIITNDSLAPYSVEVTSKADTSFYDKGNDLTSIIIPSEVTHEGISYMVTSIGVKAFAYCSSLKSIEIPSSITHINMNAFHETPWYDSIPDGLVYINNILYEYKGEMPENTTIEVKDGTITIGEGAFMLKPLSSIVIPNSVKVIGEWAFSGTNLLSIALPDSLTRIEKMTFALCKELKSIVIPTGVISIGQSAFMGCSSLTSITIPSSVTSIQESAFMACMALTSITCMSNIPPQYQKSSLDLFNTIYVPKESLYRYAYADGWSEFGKILPIEGPESEGVFAPDYNPKNKVDKVAGCKFGVSIEEAINFFNNRYKPCYEQNQYEASYSNINFASTYFSHMILFFQYNENTYRREFCAIQFQKNYNTWEEQAAKSTFENLRNIYSNKYTNEKYIENEDSSIDCYYGMIEDDYHMFAPPIRLTFKKGFSKGGDEYYYVILDYYIRKTENQYNDEI